MKKFSVKWFDGSKSNKMVIEGERAKDVVATFFGMARRREIKVSCLQAVREIVKKH